MGLGSIELTFYSRLPSMIVINDEKAILEDPMNSNSFDSLKFIGPQLFEDDKLNSQSH